MQVTGDNGFNINASESLSGGQKSTVLRAGGDKLWIDTYGVFQKNRNTVTESITVVNGDNCSSNGPITINNGMHLIGFFSVIKNIVFINSYDQYIGSNYSFSE